MSTRPASRWSAKPDRLDVIKLVNCLLAYLRGERDRMRKLLRTVSNWGGVGSVSGLAYKRGRSGTGANKRGKRIAIVAVARRLVIALRRYLEQGVIPEGALLKAA